MWGELVRGYRRRLGLTQEELAAEAELSVRSIRKIESGRVARPRMSTLRALADAFALAPPDRMRFFDAQPALVEAGPSPVEAGPERAQAHWSPPDRGGPPLVVVTVDAAARPLDDVMYIQVRVRSEAGEYLAGPVAVWPAAPVS